MRLLNLSVSQLLWVFIATNLLNKLKPIRLFLRWLASYGIKSYRVPTDEELRKLQYSKKQEKKESTKSGHQQKGAKSMISETPLRPNEFKIRCSDLVKLTLNKNDVNWNTLNSIPYAEELEWVIDFAFMSLISFLLTQALFTYSSRSNEYNFSLVWVFLVVLQCLMILSQLSALYFKTKLAVGERSVCIVAAIFFLLLAMLILNTGENYLELKVHDSLQLLVQGPARPSMPNEDALLEPDQIDTPPLQQTRSLGPLANASIKLIIALICSFVGAILTFPGFRFGQMHESILVSATTSTIQKILYNINLVSPFVVICLWIPKISRTVLTKQEFIPIDDAKFESIRLYTLISTNVLRFILVRRYITAFLESAVEARIAQIRRKGGFTSNKSIQISIASLNNFTNVVCIQYILPTIMCLFTSIMFASINHCDNEDSAKKFTSLRLLFGNDQQAIIENAEELIFEIRRLLSSELTKNILGFATWWTHFAWFCTTTAGVGYYKYFMH